MTTVNRRTFALVRLTTLSAWLLVCSAAFAPAQTVTRTVVGPDGKPMVVTSSGAPAAAPAGANGKPSSPNQKPNEAKKGDEKKSDGKNDSPEPKIIRRGDGSTDDSDPEELKATVGEDGKVAFQFRNQSWIDLVQWLAEISQQPLDWQELPGDRVNLRSPGRYSVAETKDLFNRHLLARGYTLLEMPGGITVAKTEGINQAMVPRVSVDELANLMPHTFVRTSLELGWLSSEKMAEELKPMISSNGRLTALSTTNRIEAMDAAVNLTQVADLLAQERDQTSRESLAPEFKLRHISAETAKTMLEEFLGVSKKETPMTPQQIQMMAQMRARSGNNAAQPAQKKVEISIVANPRQNSVLIRAPVDRIAIATEFIHRIDVPGQALSSLSQIESRVQVFRLFSIDPEKMIEIISDMNVLEPGTRLRADKTNGALIVSGSVADRFIIEKLIKRLDGSGRQFEVLQLRRLDATEVAESISFLMGKDKDEDDSNSYRRTYYYGYGYGNNQDDDKSDDEFRVAANARYRQVLLWANESEMEQVRNLLVKLGELPPPGGNPRTVRTIDASSSPETYEYLLRLKQQWSQISDTPLELPDSSEFVDPLAPSEDEASDESDSEGDASESSDAADDKEGTDKQPEDASEPTDKDLVSQPAKEPAVTLTAAPADEAAAEDTRSPQSDENTTSGGAQPGDATINSAKDFDRLFGNRTRRPATEPAAEEQATQQGPKPAIEIRLDRDGNLILVGKDAKVLDQLEDLMLQVQPPRRPYHVFKIKHQSAGYVQLNLEEYFAEEDEDSEADRLYRWWYDMDEPSDDGPAGLGKGNKLRFVYDPDTNTIVVSGATSSQLKTIGELIELWDVAEPANKRRMRYTKLVTVQYGRAGKIAETVKEAYRDLLSSNDKTFAGGKGGGGGGGGGGDGEKSSGRESRGSGLIDSENGRDGGEVDFSFKGKLSLGVDEIGNTLLVSAEGEPLLELVVDMIGKLDEAAKPAGEYHVLSVSGSTSPESIENVLEIFKAQQAIRNQQPNQPQANNNNNGGQPPQARGNFRVNRGG